MTEYINKKQTKDFFTCGCINKAQDEELPQEVVFIQN